MNLCPARDAMAGGGTITVTAENKQIVQDGELPADFVEFAVADTGCGMPPEVLRRAFEPFFTTKDVGKGSGLGLPQVYGFAQQSGGRVRIDSTVGEGTVVTLLLPRSSRPVAVVDADDASNVVSARNGERSGLVLLADDNEVAAITREMLAPRFTVIMPHFRCGAGCDGRCALGTSDSTSCCRVT